MIALTIIDINASTKQIIDISTVNLQEVVVANAVDEQTITIDQDTLQEIDIGAIPSQEEIKVKQDGITINVYDVPSYEGEYIVTPKTTEQTLSTAHRILQEDVHINKIPYFEVGNNSGGDTVYIGSEV